MFCKVKFFLVGYFVLAAGMVSCGSWSVYAGGEKKLSAEDAVFDLKASSSASLTVYGCLSDKGLHPVANATVTLKPPHGAAQEVVSDSAGLYSIGGVTGGETYTVFASKEGLGRSNKVKLKIKEGEDEDLVVRLKFKKNDNSGGGNPKPTPTPTPSNEGKPKELVHVPLYSSSNPFTQKIESNPEIDANSDDMVNGLVSQAAIGFVIALKEWTVPVFYADENTSRYDVTLTCGNEWGLGVTKMKNVPIPDWAEPSDDEHNGGINLKGYGCGGNDKADTGDYAMVVIDPLTRCEFDFWQANKTKGKWTASWANSISIDGNGVYEKGISCRGSGFALLNGLIWPDELKAGRIDHALAFSYDLTKAGGPVSPATESDGTSKGSDAMPEGARVQLDPALDLNSLGLNDYEKTIAKALQEYGMILVDDGGGMSFYAVHPTSAQDNPYEGILPDKNLVSVENIPADKFRVLKLPPQDADWQDKLELVDSGCAAME